MPPDGPVGPERFAWLSLTLALVTLALLFWQGNREASEREVFDHYHDSGLAEMEVPAYLSWLRLEGRLDELHTLERHLEEGNDFAVFRTVAWNRHFPGAVEADSERYWSDRQHEQWQALREEFHTQLGTLPEVRGGLTPSEPRPATLVTFHFLNPGFAHWLIAMLVLLPLAPALEGTLGPVRMLLIWLAGGVSAGAAGAALLGEQHLPLTGTSVLVSTAAGMFLGRFGTQQLPFLVPDAGNRSLARRSLPALVIAPWWLLLPGWALLAGDHRGIWVPQLLALGAGALLVQLTRLPDITELEEHGEDNEAETELRARLASAWAALGSMSFTEAEQQFLAACRQDPENFNALCGLYQVRKLRPASNEWLATTLKLLSLDCPDPGQCRQQRNILREARTLQADRLSLPEKTRCRLAANHARIDAFRDAEQLLGEDDHASGEPKARGLALTVLAQRARELGDHDRANHYEARAKALGARQVTDS